MPIDAVIFDIDGTLLGYDEKLMYGKVAACLETDGTSVRTLVGGFLSGVPDIWPSSPDVAPAHWERFAVAMAEHVGMRPAAVPALIRTIKGFGDGYFAFPDALACLDELGRLPLAVLTNNHVEHMPPLLRRCGIDPAVFRLILAGYQYGFAKPDPTAFLTAAKMLATAPGRCAFVDDTPAHVRAAEALGMQAWLVDRADRHRNFDGRRVETLVDFAAEIIHDVTTPVGT